MSRVVARAPARIDLGGGWTDVPPYCDREGGFVCNVAITRLATAVVSDKAEHPTDIAAQSHSESELVRAVGRRAALKGARLQLVNDFPVGAGLGGSSAASAALLVAAATWRHEAWTPRGIAELGRRIEVEDLGVAGGRQDHYAAAFGGALALTFGAGPDVGVRHIPLSSRVTADFVARSVLVYTGQSRVSGDTITAVLGAYQAGDSRVVHALRRMREIAESMASALARGDLDVVSSLLGEQWEFQRSLHRSIPTPLIDDIVARARSAGALGAKAMGASGGGCVLIMAPVEAVARVRAAVSGLGTILDFGVAMRGVEVVAE